MDHHKETHLQVLKYARDLLSRENGWTQHSFARNENGESVNIYDEGACSFCITGAVQRAIFKVSNRMDNFSYPEFNYGEIINYLYNVVGTLIGWNDDEGTSIEDVLKLINDVIERLEQE